MTSDDNMLLVLFTTDNTVQKTGFRATFYTGNLYSLNVHVLCVYMWYVHMYLFSELEKFVSALTTIV